MAIIRVTKEFNFEMAHALYNYDGLCKHIHGHSYKLFVTIAGTPETNTDSPKLGMVMDFGELKKIINKNIVDIYDHALVLNQKSEGAVAEHQMFDRKIIVDYQPTSENLIIEYAKIIEKHLPKHIKLHSLKLYETATSFVEWFASDNC